MTVVPEAGLHARPASKFVRTANEFESDVTIARADDGDPANARSMLAVTGLGVECGDDVRIVAEGEDAAEALDALARVLSTPESGDDPGSGDDPDGEDEEAT